MVSRIIRQHIERGRVQQRSQCQRIWQAMRIMRQFSVRELMAVCEVDRRHSVQMLLWHLKRAGYLRMTPKCGSVPCIYTLIRDSGPHCPAVIHRRTRVWDPNTDTEYPI